LTCNYSQSKNKMCKYKNSWQSRCKGYWRSKYKIYKHKNSFLSKHKRNKLREFIQSRNKVVLKQLSTLLYTNFGYFITLALINTRVKKNVSMSSPLSLCLQTRTTKGWWMQCTIPTILNWRLNNIQMFINTFSKKSPLLQMIW
jgi:hypothetical protein